MKGTCQLLLVEDDPIDAEVVTRLLDKSPRARFQIEWATTLDEAAQALAARRFQGVLLDLGLPGTSDLEALVRLRKASASTPIVVVTDLNVEEVALRALNHGAQDYLIKGTLTTDNLVRSIDYAAQRQCLVRKVTRTRSLLQRKNHRLARLYRTAHRFVDNVSHEFRTPLTVIKEYVALIRDGVVGAVSEEQRQMLTVVEDRADDLNTMVDDMLDVSKFEAGLLGVYRQRCNVADIVDRVRLALERKAAVKDVALEIDIDPDLPAVYCDPEKAGRILINLAINAIKFCGQPGRVALTGRAADGQGGVVLSVCDNGPGISAENREAIFRRFKQLSESVRSSTKGFGLGLSIAKELVELNLGEMMLESEPGRGSTFSFTLPPDDPPEVMRRYLARVADAHSGGAHVSLVRAALRAAVGLMRADEAGEFLCFLLRPGDLLFRTGAARWLVALPITVGEVKHFQERAEKAVAEANRNRIGEPLPELELECLGAWNVVHGAAHALATLQYELQSEELCHA